MTVDNAAAIAAVRAHHAELAEQLQVRTAAVLAAASSEGGGGPRDALHAWYREELMPHILAEELALYGPAGELEATRLLVCGMLAEHKALVALIGELASAPTGFAAATTAAAAHALFGVHLEKENDLLLPALDGAGVDVAALLDGMHDVLGGHAEPGDCGCGCGHDDQAADGPVPVQLRPAVLADDELDVRTLPHGQRHEIIFGRLQALGGGESLVIVNDHDPKPLRYQTQALWPDEFEWMYRDAGPEVWRVAITRAG